MGQEVKEKDIVEDILSRAVAAVFEYLSNHQGFEQSMADAIAGQIRAKETKIRKDWGGSEPYVAARPAGIAEAKRRALEDAQKTGKVSDAASRHGISRATVYRLLRKRD
jgi:transcriptional regulator of acetoin/glycerol metabolism